MEKLGESLAGMAEGKSGDSKRTRKQRVGRESGLNDNRGSFDSTHCIASVDDKMGPFRKLGEGESFVVRRNHDTVLGAEVFFRPSERFR